jgi:hypothetical protein
MPRNKSIPPRKKLTMPQIVAPPVGSILDLKAAIVKALEDQRYQWRTLDGIARTVKATSEAEILRVLDSMPDQIVRTTTADGRTVFTTRNHYNETHGFGDKLLSVLTDKVVA